MRPLPLFVFGTLMDANLRYGVLGRTVPCHNLKPALVKRRATFYVDGRNYPMLCPHPSGRVLGLLIRNLTAQDWRLLDEYEGPEYILSPIAVQSPAGKRQPALTYLCPPHIKASYRRWKASKKRTKERWP